ncbi:MAG: hypothetical protein LBE08_07245 [Bifidobacteriaceae bacterium]|nr:hypothetical protein [Bifidobacteriaceae bacterium]
MIVGVYVDGFNLYYGGVGLAGGHSVPGWRWIDLRQLATNLLLDALSGSVEAALVISNDSDLALPVAKARSAIPVGVINPTTGQTAGALKLAAGQPVGLHWGRRLTLQDLTSAQLPGQVGKLRKPAGW